MHLVFHDAANPPPVNRIAFLQGLDYADTLDENAAWDAYRLAMGQEIINQTLATVE